MKKTTFFKFIIVFITLLLSFNGIAQTYKPFSIRKNIDIKGSMLVIGNNILGKDNSTMNDNTVSNENINMQYIDIDGDPSTFSSSSANLILPTHEDGSATTCYGVAYAGLYWGAMLQSGSRTDINKVRFKLPGSSTYTDITGEIVYDANVNPIISIPNEPTDTPYACYADVTNLLSGLSNVEGTYTMANVISSQGSNNSTGLSAGWTLIVIYEDPTLHMKSFTTFDGFSHIFDGHQETVNVTGFTTPKSGHVDLQFAYAALDGDKTHAATKLEINGKQVVTQLRTANKFFNSTIENIGYGETPTPPSVVYPRNPSGSNTLGYDTGFLEIKDAEPEYIKNNVSTADFRLQVAQGQADPIFAFFSAFAVDIISPDILLTKTVQDEFGNDINGSTVTFGDYLFYEITYQNVGNDDVTNFTITDVLPEYVSFDILRDIVDLSTSGGAQLFTYNFVTREMVFTIPDSSVEIGDPQYSLLLRVRVLSDCNDYADACSNQIYNQAFATYRGVINTNVVQNQGSYLPNGCLGDPEPTNVIVGTLNCQFISQEVLCGSTVVLTAANGYDSYTWSTSPSGTPVIGTGQTFTANGVGTYYVIDTSANCTSITEEFNVVPYGSTTTNPVIPYADQVVICPNDGKELPYIFLCGANDSRNIQTNISDATSIIWQQLDESSCAAVVFDECANESTDCTWVNVGTGPDYVANTSGQFRLVINYPGGCFSRFYFNVYQNLLNPTATSRDIYCTTPGQITVGGVPNGYEYSLDGTNYQSSNVFTVTSPGLYTIYIRQVGVNTNPCIFSVPDILIRQRDFTVTSNVTQPLCYGDKGSIHLAANDVRPQYFFALYDNVGTLVNSVGPIIANDYIFAGLNSGDYRADVSTEDGCFESVNFTIIEPPLLTATVALTRPLTCTPGEITIYPDGGTPPYLYYINSTTVFQDTPTYTVTAPGDYNIIVEDTNGCTATTSIHVDGILPPDYSISQTSPLCSDSNDGTITINVTNANGNTILYSIDNGASFVTANVFTGLTPGDYNVVLQYTAGTADPCATAPQLVTITAPAPVTGTVSTTPLTCTTNGSITVTGSGGTGALSYSIDGVNFQPGTTFSGLNDGTYTITIMDANGCTFTTSATINALDPPTDMVFSNTPLSCPANTSDVTITNITGGVSPYEYQITAPAASATGYQSSNVFAGLDPGTYTFQVRDVNGCTYSESYTITPLDPITVVGQVINNITCLGASDGSVRFTVSGTTGFTYSLDGGPSTAGTSPIDISGLSAGNHTIVVTDNSTNCTATDTVTVGAPASTITISSLVTPATCNAGGSVTVNTSGGWGGYSYLITDPIGTDMGPQSSNVFSNLTLTGNYTITVTDANGCVATDVFTINTAPAPTLTLAADSVCLNGGPITLTATTIGGNPPFQYSLNGGPTQTSNVFTVNGQGNYTVTVIDAYGCPVTSNTIVIASQLTAIATVTKGLDCSVSPDASVEINVSGGTANYTYEVSTDGGTTYSTISTNNPSTTEIYSTSIGGSFDFRVTDSVSCVALTNTVVIQPVSNPFATASATDVFCNSDNSGSVTINIDQTQGEPPYTVSFNGSPFTSQTVYSGLTAGTYSYIIRDSNSCEFTDTVTVNEPNAITPTSEVINPITCTGAGNALGSIDVTISGGTPDYTYTLLDNSGNLATTSSTNPIGPTASTNVSFADLSFGNYYLRVIDANNCEYNFGPYLVASDVNDLTISATSFGTCVAGVTYDIHIVNGVGPFRIRIYDGTPFNPGDGVSPNGLPTSDVSPNERNHEFTNLEFDVNYVFEVLDTSTSCTYIQQVVAEPSPSPMILTGAPTNVICKGDANGTYAFTASVYDGSSLSWEVFDDLTNASTGITGSAIGLTGADYSDTATGLGPGDYYLTVTETDLASTQCSKSISFRITEPTELLLAEVTNTNANCNQLAQVVVNASGGVPPYEYAFVQDGQPSSGWTSNSFAALDPSVNVNWDVYVRDSGGCAIGTPLDVVIAADPTPSVTVPAIASDQCTSTGNSYTFTATPGGGEIMPVTYSIDGVNFQSSATFTVTATGTYTVTIRDGNGCTATDTITIYPPLQVDVQASTQPSCAAGGVITVNGIGGSGNYSFVLLDSASNPTGIGITGSDFLNVPTGDYIVEVTDTTTGCPSTTPITLETPTPVTLDPETVTNVSCNGGSDGSITVNLASGNDNPPYTYEITAPINVGPQNSNIFTGLAAGSYDILVTSGRGCTATQTIIVSEPAILITSGIIDDFACAVDNSVNTATLTINGVGGTTPYTYSIDGINYFTTNTFDIIDNGSSYTQDIFVKDDNGCITPGTVNITPLPALTSVAAAEVTPFDCNNTGSVIINVTGGSGNFEYVLLPSGTPQASNIFNITTPGDYYFQVNDLDTGCYMVTSAFTVAPFDTIDVTATPATAVTCFGDTNGAFEFTVSGYTGNYDYQVFDSSGNPVAGISGSANTSVNPRTITGMSAGNYTIVVTETDSPFCSATSNTFTIGSPATALTVSATETSNVTCDDNKGTITAVANGGWGTYEYELMMGASVIAAYSPNNTFTDLSAGTYTVNVRDAGGCIAFDTVTLNLPNPINATVTPSTTLLSCFGDTNATITVSGVSGGQGTNYTYTLNMASPVVSSSGPQVSNVFSGLGAGTYTVDVTDGYNCIFTSAPITINEPTPIEASLVKASSQTCTTTDATLTLSATGGTGTYEYSDDPNFATPLGTFVSSVNINVPDANATYVYYVRDANGCISNASNEITIDKLPDLTVTLDTSNAVVNCAGDSTGVIVATAQGGLGNYVYTLQDGSQTDIPGATQNSPGVFTELPIGTYQVQVESGDCLITSAPVTITEPNLPLQVTYNVTDVVCAGSNDGILEITATGGSGLIQYAISPQLNQFFDDPIFDNLAPGNYQAIAQDQLGCYVVFDFVVNEPVPVSISIVPNSIVPEMCYGDMNGSFSIDISGGNLPYSVALDDINGTYTVGGPTQTQFDFINLSGGDHIVYIRDNFGCESEWNITFPESVLINPQVSVDYGCVNNVSGNTVTVTVDESITNPSDLEYSLDGGPYQSSNIFTDVPSGLGHYIDVRHTNGCIKQTPTFDITQYEPLTLVLSNGGLNEILATATGGSGDYEFTLNGESYGSTNTFIIYESGNYTVTVTDSFGCVATATGYFEYIDVCIPNYFTPGSNDELKQWGPGCTSQYKDLTVDIFDRYGRKIATLRVNEYWDGKYNGIELPTGDYWYVVRLNDPKDDREFVGHFTLYR